MSYLVVGFVGATFTSKLRLGCEVKGCYEGMYEVKVNVWGLMDDLVCKVLNWDHRSQEM